MRWGNPNVVVGPEDRGDGVSHLYGFRVIDFLRGELADLLQVTHEALRLVESDPAKRAAGEALGQVVAALDGLEGALARYGEEEPAEEEGEAAQAHDEGHEGGEALNEALAALTSAREGRRRQLAALNARVAELADHF
jgi:hypothetical protein